MQVQKLLDTGFRQYSRRVVVACDLCGSTSYEVIWDKAERKKQGVLIGRIIPGHIHSRNVMCRNCGLVYVEPKMSREELAEFYSNGYRKIYSGSGTIEGEKLHADTVLKIIKGIFSVDAGSKLLDVGCSTGELVGRVGVTGFDASGIEPNVEYYEIAKAKGLKVENCGIEEYAPRFKFDMIVMTNALEHVYSPTEVLSKINSLLTDNGYILISVPDFYNKDIRHPVDVFLSNAHLYNFSIATLSALFNKCGFAMVQAYHMTEQIGEKIYLVGKKANIAFTPPVIDESDIESAKKHLETAQKIYELKEAVRRAGYR